MKYELLVTDFDDTLIRDNRTIGPDVLDSIKLLIDRGGKFAICTGRMFRSIRKEALRAGLEGTIICYQGALISDLTSGETLHHTPMPVVNAVKIARILEECGIYFQIYIDDTLTVAKRTEYTEAYEKICDVTAKITGIPLSEYIIGTDKPVTKMIAMGDPEKMQKYITEFGGKYPEFLFNCSKPYFMEIIDKKASKGEALRWLCKYLGTDIAKCAAVGDSLNDLPMIEAAGLGIAVANAMPVLKEKADIITVSNNDGAIKKIIEEYFL